MLVPLHYDTKYSTEPVHDTSSAAASKTRSDGLIGYTSLSKAHLAVSSCLRFAPCIEYE